MAANRDYADEVAAWIQRLLSGRPRDPNLKFMREAEAALAQTAPRP